MPQQLKRQVVTAVLASEESKEATHKPNIGNAQLILEATRPQRLHETAEERAERLSRRDWEAIQRKRKQLEEEYYDQYGFKPTLNPVSEVR